MTTTNTAAWITTDSDTCQHCRQLSETAFEFVQMENRREQFCAFTGIVDIADYFGDKDAQEQLRVTLGMYGYDSWLDLELEYGEAAFRIAAECIFETYMCGCPDHVSDTAEECRTWLDDYMTENAL